MNEPHLYMVCPNRQPTFELNLGKFKRRLEDRWGDALKIEEPLAHQSFRCTISKQTEQIVVFLDKDKASMGIKASKKPLFFEFALWVVDQYPKTETIHMFNMTSLDEHVILSDKKSTTKGRLEEIFTL